MAAFWAGLRRGSRPDPAQNDVAREIRRGDSGLEAWVYERLIAPGVVETVSPAIEPAIVGLSALAGAPAHTLDGLPYNLLIARR